MSDRSTEIPQTAGVGLVQKTLQVLDLFQLDRPNWSQSELTQATGMPRSTINRLVRFLTDRGYLALPEGRNRYTLGPAAIDLGRRASALFDFREICQPALEQLARQTTETVLLTSVVSAGNAVRCVDQIESTREGLRVFEQIGAVFPLHAGAAPKAVLAFLPEEDRKRYLSRPMSAITGATIIDPDLLERDLRSTRNRGYSVSREETYEGVAGVGAPFFWSDGRPAGSMAVAMPIQRASGEAIAWCGDLLQQACSKVDELHSTQRRGPEQKAASR
ncbi:IclR family transcriptional regulator [Hoeflea sp.]|uniref:IclR family transcriptional regulator n=1 Tax=Hoeflea sp. TaxID=1940281 RepID=UPI003B01D2B9